MASVENRIVQMQFDNTAFEQKMSTTISSLEKLNTTLANTGAKNGLEQVSQSAKNFSMDGVRSAVDGISAKFAALATIGITALSNIVNRAVDAGLQLANAFTFAPITDGFSEFELKMGSIQTIMAGSGESLEVVNRKLDELNTYADRTIYSFSDMTSNIGKFTNAGVSLDDSVAAIQGVANVAALSGANSNEASRAMYNFAQAISSGSVKLIDWKSIELANMGTVEFKQQLIDTAVAMGTLTETSDGYITSAGTAFNATEGFNNSLADAWLTSEALTETLGRYSDTTTDIGARATAAAQDVKTFSHMMDALKESAGSGWAQTWELLIGDFEEGKALWTEVNKWADGAISASAEARNTLLEGWKEAGGRDALIDGLRNAAKAIGSVVTPIKNAFRDIFPAMTVDRLVSMTERFRDFMDSLIIFEDTADAIRRAFAGLFAAIEIGWTVFKNVIGLVKDFFGAFDIGLTDPDGGVLGFFANFGDKVVALNEKLVEGGGIADFFANLKTSLAGIGSFLKDVITDIGSFLMSLGGGSADAASAAVGRLSDRFGSLKNLLGRFGDIWSPLAKALDGVKPILDRAWQGIKDWFSNLGDKLAEIFGPGEFDAVLDALNVSLLGGIALALKKFIGGGVGIDLGGGFLKNISKSFEELTGILEAMQANLKTNALLKIAGALGILTLSLILLSTIDSGALSRALGAMAIGFGQLIGAFALLNKIGIGPASAAKLGILAGGMILLASAMLVLSVAVKALSSMSWGELLKGLTGVTVLMGVMVAASAGLSKASGPMIRAGIGMIAMAVALNILAVAVKQFSDMSWQDLAKGLGAVAVGLGLMVGAMALLSKVSGSAAGAGVGMLMTAAALVVLSVAVERFASMSWSQMAKGLAGVAGGLVAIGLSMKLMPKSMAVTGAGLLLVSGALLVIAKALESFGGMSWGEIGKGLAGMAASLLLLAVAAQAMTGAIAGAAAMAVMAVSLTLLAKAIKEFGQMKISTLVQGLVALVAVLVSLSLTASLLAPLAPALLALGVAMLALSAAFALFGVGALAVAQAFEIVAQAGQAGVGILMEIIDGLILRIPDLVTAFAVGLLALAQTFIDAAPALIEGLTVILDQLLQTIITLMPRLTELLIALITTIITVIREKLPDFIQLGIDLILAFLQGMRDNIAEIVVVAVELLVAFVNALAENVGLVVEAVVNLITSFIDAVAAELPRIIDSAVNLLISFLSGLTNNLDKVATAITTVITTLLTTVVNMHTQILNAGVDALVKFLQGITDNLIKVVNAVGDMIAEFITAVGNKASDIIDAGLGALTDFLQGIADNLSDVIDSATDVVEEFIEGIGDMATDLIDAGVDMVLDVIEGLGQNAVELAEGAMDVVIDFLDGLATAIDTKGPELRDAGKRLVGAVLNGMTFGLAGKAVSIGQTLVGGVKSGVAAVGRFLGIGSPSKLFMEIGGLMMEGMAIGISDNTHPKKNALQAVKTLTGSVQDRMSKFGEAFSIIDDIDPVITPVLDLSQVRRDAALLATLIPDGSLTPDFSYSQARNIASTTRPIEDESTTGTPTGPSEVTFEQNIYAPKQLSTGDIYRQTRNQIAMAKEELAIP